MKLRVLWVGRTKNRHLTALIEDYTARIRHFLPLDTVEVKEPRENATNRIQAEGEKLLAAIGQSDRVVVLDLGGRSWTSEEFARFLQRHMSEDARNLTFVIGGHAGLSEGVKERADLSWALSPLTFTHDLTRVVLLEQIYRALAIIHHLPYSK
jgi:23S rRNA (pseudouridine1915-N3)-methyltransferase